jgi:curved DNA-binding protein CbpA
MDYYKILNLNKDCTLEDIKKSYKKLALKWHPDRNNANKDISNKKFKEISEAYSVLSNPKSRQKYDNKQEYPFPREGNLNDFQNPFDQFESFFGRNNDIFFRNNSDNFFENNFNNDFFNNNFKSNFFTDQQSFVSSNTKSFSNFSSKRESTKIVNGKTVKETIIEDNNGKTEIYEINGKITKKIVTSGGKSDIYYYDDKGKFIKDN